MGNAQSLAGLPAAGGGAGEERKANGGGGGGAPALASASSSSAALAPKRRQKKKKKKIQNMASPLRPEELDYEAFLKFIGSVAAVSKFSIQATRNLGRDIVCLELVAIPKIANDTSGTNNAGAAAPGQKSLLACLNVLSPSTMGGVLPNLHTLNLQSNPDLGNGTLALGVLADILQQRQSITALDVSGCPVGSGDGGGDNFGGSGANTSASDGAALDRALDRALSMGDNDDDHHNEGLTEEEDEAFERTMRFAEFISAALDGKGVLKMLRMRESELTDDDFAGLVRVTCVRRSMLEHQLAKSQAEVIITQHGDDDLDPEGGKPGGSTKAGVAETKTTASSATNAGEKVHRQLAPFLHTLDVSNNALTEVSVALLRNHLIPRKQAFTGTSGSETLPVDPPPAVLPSDPVGEIPSLRVISRQNSVGEDRTAAPERDDSIAASSSDLDITDPSSPSFLPAFAGIHSLQIGGNPLTTRACASLAMALPSMGRSVLRCFDFGCGLARTWADPPVMTRRRVAKLFITASEDRDTNDMATSSALISELLLAVPAVPFGVIVDALRDLAVAEARSTLARLRNGSESGSGSTYGMSSTKSFVSASSGVSSASEGEDAHAQHMNKTKRGHDHLPLFYCLRHRQALLVEELFSHREFFRTTICHVAKGAQVRTTAGRPFTGVVSLPIDTFLLDTESMATALEDILVTKTKGRKNEKKHRGGKQSKSAAGNSSSDETKKSDVIPVTALPREVGVSNPAMAASMLFRRPARRNRAGKTALHIALRSGSPRLIRAILNQNVARPAEVRGRGSWRRQRQSGQGGGRKKGKGKGSAASASSSESSSTSTFTLWMKADEDVDLSGQPGVNDKGTEEKNSRNSKMPCVLTLNGQFPDMCGINEREGDTGLPPLRIACRLGLRETVNELLNLGADVRSAALSRPSWDYNGCNALHEACIAGMTRYAIQLLQQASIAVDVNGLSLPALCVDAQGRSPLMFCLLRRNLALAKANLLSLTGGLHRDSGKGHAAGTEALLGLTDDCNRDTLAMVVQWQGFESTRLLIRAGAHALLDAPKMDDQGVSLSTTGEIYSNYCSSCACVSEAVKAAFQKCLPKGVFDFFMLDIDWVADRLVHSNRLSGYGCALLRHEQALRHLERDMEGGGEEEERKQGEQDDQEGADGENNNNKNDTERDAGAVSAGDIELGVAMPPKAMRPHRRHSLNMSARVVTMAGQSRKKRNSGKRGKARTKATETLSQARNQAAQWSILRLKKEKKHSHDKSLDVLAHQLEGDMEESASADAAADAPVEVVTPFEREKVSREILRAFDEDDDVQSLRRTSALIRVRREAVSYTIYVIVLVVLTLFLTVGRLEDPAQNHAFVVAASDKVVGQDSPGLPPPNRDFFAIQSIDHFWAWMDDCVLANLFPLAKNASIGPEISDTELHLPGGVLDGGAMIILNGMVRIRQIRRHNLFGEGAPCEEGGGGFYSNLWHPRHEADQNNDGSASSSSSPIVCVRTDYSASDFIDDPSATFLGANYSSGEVNMEMPFLAHDTTHMRYPASGFVFDLFTANPLGARDTVNRLKQSHFVDAQTAAVFVTFAVYNVNLRSIAVVRCLVEFTPGGARVPSFNTALIRTEDVFSTTAAAGSSSAAAVAVRRTEIAKVVAEAFLFCSALYYLLVEFSELVGIRKANARNIRNASCWKSMAEKKRYCTPSQWRWRKYSRKGWNVVDVSSAFILMAYCGLQIQVHILKSTLHGDMRDVGVWSNVLEASWYANVAEDTLAAGFLLCGLKLFKVVGLVPVSAGRVFEAIMATVVAPRVLVLLFFLLLCVSIFGMTFFFMYGSSGADGYRTLLDSFFSTVSNMLGDGDLEAQTGATFVMGHILWLVCIAALSIILLNIFIAIVSVEYERLEEAVVKRYDEQIDRRLAQLVQKRLASAPLIGISKSGAERSWVGFRKMGEENDDDRVVEKALHPVDWRSPRLASPAAVLTSKADLFEKRASLSDQISCIATLLRKVAEEQKRRPVIAPAVAKKKGVGDEAP